MMICYHYHGIIIHVPTRIRKRTYIIILYLIFSSEDCSALSSVQIGQVALNAEFAIIRFDDVLGLVNCRLVRNTRSIRSRNDGRPDVPFPEDWSSHLNAGTCGKRGAS